MTDKKLAWLIGIINIFLGVMPISAIRSFHRSSTARLPRITTQLAYSPSHKKKYQLICPQLSSGPLRLYNEKFFKKHMLPNQDISYRYNSEKKVNSAILKKLVEELLKEIKAGKKKYTHFIILQVKDFNVRKHCGLLVLKFKEYPFVLKLFMETPKTFVSTSSGIEPMFFFCMSEGVNRHLLGFTRIANKIEIEKRLQKNSLYANKIETPRKWYLLPNDPAWIQINAYNMPESADFTITIPGIYGIIADYIETEQKFSIFNGHDRTLALKLCNSLDLLIDPHITNFMVDAHTLKLVIVDTEHFPSVVGFKHKKQFTSYLGWYTHLANKAAHDIFFKSKHERLFPPMRAPELWEFLFTI